MYKRQVEAEERAAKAAEVWANIEENKRYTGTVKSLTSYGAFVDIGGVDGLVHISELSWNRIKHPSEVVNVGDTVKVYNKIKEGNRERIQIFEGVVIKRQNGGARETFTVRKNSNGIGVEKTWPVHSPFVDNIEVVRRGKVRRAKLNYLRDRVGKKAKVKELVK